MTDPLVNISFDKDHLKPLERAARILCSMNGDDPDKPIPAPHPLGLQVPFSEPLWHHAASALHELNQMIVALKMAHVEQQAEGVKVPH